MIKGNKTLIFVNICTFVVMSFFIVQNSVAEKKKVKMVVTAAFVSDKGLDIYRDIADYLGSTLGWEIEVVSGISYSEANAKLDDGSIQVGAVCGLPYTHKYDEGKYELLAIPVMGLTKGMFDDANGYEKIPGKYYSYTIVHKDSKARSWSDIKGKSFAYNDQGSNSGYNMPRNKLVSMGYKSWESFFSKVEISGSHENSIRMVSRGEVDASSVDSLVLDFDRSINDHDAWNVKIIEHLGPAGAPPIVISKKADPTIKKAFQTALLKMHRTNRGRAILRKAMLRKFIRPHDRNYDDIREMESNAKRIGFSDPLQLKIFK